MTSPNEIAVLELLSSKVCHDLISPIGAINNGLEIFEEMGAEDAGDIIGLIAHSAQIASAKLQAFRLAYGMGGSDPSIKPENVHTNLAALMKAEGKFAQDWNPHGPVAELERPDGFCKMLMAGAMLIMEQMPKGGTISIEAGSGECDIVIHGRGEGINIRDGVQSTLEGENTPMEEPRLTHAYMTGAIARAYGFSLTLAADDESAVRLDIKLL